MILLKKIIVISVTLLMYSSIGAQTNTDSLYALWKDATVHDTTRIAAFDTYIRDAYYYTKPDSAIILRDELITFLRKGSYDDYLSRSLLENGYLYFLTGNYPEALRDYKETVKIANRTDQPLVKGDALIRTGFIYHDNEDYIRALRYYEQGLEIFETANDSSGMSSVYNELGSLYRARNNLDKSLDYYHKSIAYTLAGEEIGHGPQYNNLGLLYVERKDFKEAISNFKKAQELFLSTSDQSGIASNLTGLGLAYRGLGQTDKALKLLMEGLRVNESVNNKLGISETLLDLSDLYLESGENSEAITACKKSLMILKKLGDLGGQAEACDCLYKAYKATGATTSALDFFERGELLNDSIQSEKISIQLQQMEFSKKVLADSLLQVEKNLEREMVYLAESRKKDKNRNIAIGTGILFLLLAIGFFSRWRYVHKSRAIIAKEKDRSESLLLNILPAEIAQELKEKGEAAARDFEMVSILFTDFKGFTEKSAQLSASELINEINHCFKAFDLICENHGIEKIKTIGDAYMAAGGLPVPSKNSVENTILAGLEMQSYMTERIKSKIALNEWSFEMRLGIHTGPVVAGIVGVKKFQYDIWGDTVNTASRIESNGEVGKVNISQSTYELLKENQKFSFEHRGKIEAKGKGAIDMWFIKLA